MSDAVSNKERELLPDILSHQGRLQMRKVILHETITKLESEWSVYTNSEKLEPSPDSPSDLKKQQYSTVDMIYNGMNELEGDFDSLAARLSLISKNYLGENKR